MLTMRPKTNARFIRGCLLHLSHQVLLRASFCLPLTHTIKKQLHVQALTKNFQYISNDKFQLKLDPKTMKLDQKAKKPVCFIMSWLLAKNKHVMKYASIYLEQGFDVVSVSCTPFQLIWPAKGSQVVARQLLHFITENNQSPLVVHGFSIGAYVWGELLIYAMTDKEKYQPVLDQIKAQIWDSPADIPQIPIGLSSTVFPKNMLLQNALKAYTKYHLHIFYWLATRHYEKASKIYRDTPCHAPTLFLLSKTDLIGSEVTIRNAYNCFVSQGIDSTWVCWDRSPHIQHYFYHREDYLKQLYNHLDKNGLVADREKMEKRLAEAAAK